MLSKIKTKILSSQAFFLILLSVLDIFIYYDVCQLILYEYFKMQDTAVYAIYSHLSQFFHLLIPILIAAFLAFFERSIPRILIKALLLSLTRLFFLIPYLYLYYLYLPSYRSIEAILAAIPEALLASVIIALKVLLIYAIIRFIMQKKSYTPSDSLSKPFDLENPAVFGIMIGTLLPFATELGITIYDTVVFFKKVGARYTAEDVFVFVFRFVFLILLFLAINALAVIFVRIIKKAKNEARSLKKEKGSPSPDAEQ